MIKNLADNEFLIPYCQYCSPFLKLEGRGSKLLKHAQTYMEIQFIVYHIIRKSQFDHFSLQHSLDSLRPAVL